MQFFSFCLECTFGFLATEFQGKRKCSGSKSVSAQTFIAATFLSARISPQQKGTRRLSNTCLAAAEICLHFTDTLFSGIAKPCKSVVTVMPQVKTSNTKFNTVHYSGHAVEENSPLSQWKAFLCL